MPIKKDTLSAKLAAAATIAIALTAAGATTTAHADSNNSTNNVAVSSTANVNNSNASNSAAQSQAQSLTALKSAQAASRDAYNQAHSAAESAQGVANAAQSSYNAASDAVAQNQNATASDQNALNSAQSKLKVDQNTASQADANVTKAAGIKSDAQAQNPGVDENAIDAANSAVNSAQTGVNNAQSAVNSDAKAVSDASAANTKAQTNLTSAQTANTNAQKSVSNAQSRVSAAQSALNGDVNTQAIIDAAQSAVNADQNDVNAKSAAANNAQQTLNNAQAALNRAQRGASQYGQTPSAPDEWYQAVQQYINDERNGNYDALSADETRLAKIENPDYGKSSWTNLQPGFHPKDFGTIDWLNYHHNNAKRNQWLKSEDNYPNYVNKWGNSIPQMNQAFSREQTLEATKYFVSAVNPIRERLGLKPLQISQQVIDGTAAYEKEAGKLQGTGADSTGPDSNKLQSIVNQYGLILPNYRDASTGSLGTSGGVFVGNYGTVIAQGEQSSISRASHINLGLADSDQVKANQGYLNVDNLDYGIYTWICGDMSGNNSAFEYAPKTLLGLLTNDNGLSDTPINVAVGYSNGSFYLMETDSRTDHSALISDGDVTATDTAALQNAVNQAQSALSQAQAALKTAQAKLATDTATLNNAKAGHLTRQQLQQNLTDAQNALKSAQSAATRAQSDLTSAQTAANTAASTLKSAQSKLATDTAALNSAKTALTQAQAKLNALTRGHQTLLDAIKAYNDALANQKKAHQLVANDQTAIAKLNDQIKAEQAALPALQKTLSTAKAALDAANAKLASARKAEATAKANVITDAKIYGGTLQVGTVPSFHADTTVPKPTLTNPTSNDPLGDEISSLFNQIAAMPGDPIPTGTTVDWTNYEKVASDARTAGTYAEDVTVTFPDGSTTTIHGVKITVLKALNSGVWRNAQLPNGARIVNGVVVNANGEIMSQYRVVNGQVQELMNANGNNTENGESNGTAAITGATGLTREQYRNAQSKLPQTGDSHSMAALGIGVASLAMMLGLAGVEKKHA